MKSLVAFLLIFGSTCLFCVSGQEFLIRGKVIDSTSTEAIPGVHVLIKGDSSGAVTDIDGNFIISALQSDTLVFSFVGYQTKSYTLLGASPQQGEIRMTVPLNASTTELAAVDVFAYKNETDFKNAVIALELPEEQKTQVYVPGYYNGPKRPVKAGAGSPISLLVNKFGKRAKIERKFEKIKANDQRQFKYSEKYNKEIVARITGLKDKELIEFMDYCTLSQNFVLEANEYEIVVAVNNCYKDFKNRN